VKETVALLIWSFSSLTAELLYLHNPKNKEMSEDPEVEGKLPFSKL